VTAHPDDVSFGLGAILDAFMFAGARVEVICLTHAQVWTMNQAPGNLATLCGAEQASAAEVLGPIRVKMLDCTEGRLGELCQRKLATEVVAAADSCHPDGLLAFDTPAGSGHLDHVAAASAGLLAAETLDLPVLGWTRSEPVAAELSREFGTSFPGHLESQIDPRVTTDRARQRLASRAEAAKARPGSAARHRLEILADTQSPRWLRA
jgi:LmbE family N-acetylglucosaminyl deacetylase